MVHPYSTPYVVYPHDHSQPPYHPANPPPQAPPLGQLKLIAKDYTQNYTFPSISDLSKTIADALLDQLATESNIENFFCEFDYFKRFKEQKPDFLLRYLFKVHLRFSKGKQSLTRADKLVKLTVSLLNERKITTNFAFYLMIKMLCVIAKKEGFPELFIRSLRELCSVPQELLLSINDTMLLGTHLELCKLFCKELAAQVQPEVNEVEIENLLFRFSRLFTTAPLKVQKWLDLSYMDFIYPRIHHKLRGQTVEELEKAMTSPVQGKGFNLFHRSVLTWAQSGYLYTDARNGKKRLIHNCTVLSDAYTQKLLDLEG